MDLTTRHDEVQWAAFAVDDLVGFHAAPTPADVGRLILLPLLQCRPRDGLS